MEKVTCEERLGGGQGSSHADMWGKVIPGRRKSRCKGPGVEVRGVLNQIMIEQIDSL